MSGSQDSIGHLCVSTVKTLGRGVSGWLRERHLDFEAGIRYRSPAGRLYAYLWWLGLVFIQVILALVIADGMMRYIKSARELERGERYLAENDFATAEACFDAALRSYPYSVAAYQYEGQLLLTRFFANTKPDHIVGYGEQSAYAGRSAEPTDRESPVHDGIAFLDIAIRLENMRTLPLIVRKQGDKISDAYFWRGRGRLYLGEWEKGIADFSNTIRIQPKHARAFFYRGCCNFAAGKLDAANADFDSAIGIDPMLRQSPALEIPFQKASLELERTITDLSRQIANLRRNPTQRKELARLHAARGDAFVMKNDLAAAFADYSRCLEIGDDEGGVTGRIALVRKLANTGE